MTSSIPTIHHIIAHRTSHIITSTMAHHNPSSSMHALTRLLTSLPQSPTSSSSTRLLSLYPRNRRPLPLTVPWSSRWLQTQSHSPSSSRSRIPEPDVPLVFPTQGSGAGINNRPENPCLNHEVAGTGKAKALMGEQDFGLGAWGDKLKSSGKGKEILDGPSDEELNARALKQLGVESSASVTSSLSSPTSSSSSIEIDQTSLPPAKRSHIPPPNVSGKKDVPAKRTARTIGLKPKKNAITLVSTEWRLLMRETNRLGADLLTPITDLDSRLSPERTRPSRALFFRSSRTGRIPTLTNLGQEPWLCRSLLPPFLPPSHSDKQIR
jgi:hypothetical protein